VVSLNLAHPVDNLPRGSTVGYSDSLASCLSRHSIIIDHLDTATANTIIMFVLGMLIYFSFKALFRRCASVNLEIFPDGRVYIVNRSRIFLQCPSSKLNERPMFRIFTTFRAICSSQQKCRSFS